MGMGLIQGYCDDSQDLKGVKEYYYQEAVKQLKSLRSGIEVLKEDENHNVLLFKVNED